MVHNLRIHLIIGGYRLALVRAPGSQKPGAGLLEHILEEEIALGVRVGNFHSFLEGRRAQDSGCRNIDWRGVERAGALIWICAIGGKINFRSGCFRRELNGERAFEKSTLLAEPGFIEHLLALGGPTVIRRYLCCAKEQKEKHSKQAELPIGAAGHDWNLTEQGVGSNPGIVADFQKRRTCRQFLECGDGVRGVTALA